MKLDDVLVIGISQSGESKDVLETVRRSRELGASTLSVTNDEESPLARAAEFHFSLRAGREESVAATKTYTAELLLSYLLVAALKGEEAPGEDVRRLPGAVREVLGSGWEGTDRYRYADHLVVASRGYNLATAQEAALKLMETSYVVAESFSVADLRHGPIAMIGQDFPVIAIVPPGKARPGVTALVENLGDRGGRGRGDLRQRGPDGPGGGPLSRAELVPRGTLAHPVRHTAADAGRKPGPAEGSQPGHPAGPEQDHGDLVIRDPGPRTSIVTSTAVRPAGPVVCILAGAVIGLVRVLSTGESTNVPLAVEQVKRSRAGEWRCTCRLADLPDLCARRSTGSVQ